MKFLTAHVNTEPEWRGGEQQTLYLLQGLRRRGYPVALIAAPQTPLYERARREGFETHGLSIRSEGDIGAMFRLAAILRRLRPAILHMHTPHAHFIGVWAARLSGNGIRRVVSRRVSFSIYRNSFFRLNWIKYRYGVDRYLAVSAAVREVLVKDGVDPGRIQIIHSGVDPDRFASARIDRRAALLKEWQLPAGIPLIGGIGALVPCKGFEHFLEAARLILDNRDCAFVIVGEGELYEELNRKARALGLEDRIRLVGFRSDIGDILKALDVFVFPSLEEGLGTSLLDALLLEKPTVASRVGGIPEVIHDERSGLLVEPGDTRALAQRVLSLLDDPAWGMRLATVGRATVLEGFSADAMVEKTLQSYRDLLR